MRKSVVGCWLLVASVAMATGAAWGGIDPQGPRLEMPLAVMNGDGSCTLITEAQVPRAAGSILPPGAERIEIVDGTAYLGVSVKTNSEVKV